MIQGKALKTDLPGSPVVQNVDTTVWGRMPTVQSVVKAFDNSSESRKYQDVGLDGLMDQDEQSFFTNYLQKAQTLAAPDAYTEILKDPSSDDFHYFRGY